MATSGSLGSRSHRDANDPLDQEIEAVSITRSPTAVAPPEKLSGPTTMASPTNPTTAASTVCRGTRSPAASRQTTICRGTEPAIIAATPESMRVSATCTRPTPNASSATPTAAAWSAWRRSTRSERRATTTMPARIAAAARNRVPAVRSGGSVRTAILIAT